jgi:hypothetical protein
VPSALTSRRWFPRGQPQTLAIAVALLYWNGILLLLGGLVGLHFGALALLLLLGDLAGAFGVSNDRRWGYYLATVAAIVPLALLILHPLFGFGSVLGSGFLTLIFDIALVALLVHPMSRSHVKVWFR